MSGEAWAKVQRGRSDVETESHTQMEPVLCRRKRARREQLSFGGQAVS